MQAPSSSSNPAVATCSLLSHQEQWVRSSSLSCASDPLFSPGSALPGSLSPSCVLGGRLSHVGEVRLTLFPL